MRRRRHLVLAGLVVATVLAVAAARTLVPPENVCPDFIQFWTAAQALSQGQDPYDPAMQAAVQGSLGWKKADQGLGVYDFLPYYYPPWLALAVVPLLPLGYPLAKIVWLVVGAEWMLASAALLLPLAGEVSAVVVFVLFAAFGFSIKAVAMGQVAPLVLFLVVLSWRFLEERRDVAAGACLALLTIKPQLTLVLIAALLAWSWRMRRRSVAISFVATLVAVCAAATAAFPAWPGSLAAATRVTPMPTFYYPGLGTTWLVALDTAGVGGFLRSVAYCAVVVPLLLAVMRIALREDRPLSELYSLALLAPFFVAPYARPYDFPILLMPALVLLATRLAELGRAMLVFALVAVAGLQILYLTANYEAPVVGVRRPEFTYFWVPALLGLIWLCCPWKGSRKHATDLTADRISIEPRRPR